MRRDLSCLLFGHRVNDLHAGDPCRCGARILGEEGETRIRHTVSCFVGGHRYHRIATRDDHHESLCAHCGHTLLFEARDDPFSSHTTFLKKVRYLCNLFGHRVHFVVARDGWVEHACACGHAFLVRRDVDVVRHPPDCLVAGHFVRFVARRDGHAEYRCRVCGHPFCFPLRVGGSTVADGERPVLHAA